MTTETTSPLAVRYWRVKGYSMTNDGTTPACNVMFEFQLDFVTPVSADDVKRMLHLRFAPYQFHVEELHAYMEWKVQWRAKREFERGDIRTGHVHVIRENTTGWVTFSLLSHVSEDEARHHFTMRERFKCTPEDAYEILAVTRKP